MKTLISTVIFLMLWPAAAAQETEIVYLSGRGKDRTIEWDFYCTEGRKSGEWHRIPVPSCWELEGFGTYNYGHDPNKADEKGKYKYEFEALPDWKNKQVNIVFEGSMTDTEVMINGKSAGSVHRGAFYEFQYDISKLLKYGKSNLLEVTVSKMSSNASVNAAERTADYWVFGGIFRPVYLEVLPKNHIERTAIDATADGRLKAHVFTNNKHGNRMTTRVLTMNGEPVGELIHTDVKRNEPVIIQGRFPDILPWNPEHPHRYEVEFTLLRGEELLHIHRERIGFRTIEVREKDGIYLNGTKIRLKGVNRHTFHPESGRTTSKQMSIEDVKLIKGMNMNAVRMSHYPPDKHFLDACDSLGLLVLDELAGWQTPPYDTEIGKKLVKEMVIRDVNHPCVVFWDNGNEGGWNPALDREFGKYDPQNRRVLHPWGFSGGIDTQHYRPYNYGVNSLFHGREVFMPTEFLHGLYDGGHGAGLEDYWGMIRNHPTGSGGFLWALVDECVVRTDRDGILDCDGNHAPDGILGPYREKEGSYYAIRDIWAPVAIDRDFLTWEFEGHLRLENRFFFTNLSECEVRTRLLKLAKPERRQFLVADVEDIDLPDLEPGEKGNWHIQLPPGWDDYDLLVMDVIDPHGLKVRTFTLPIKSPAEVAEEIIPVNGNDEVTVQKTENLIRLSAGTLDVDINRNNGTLVEVRNSNVAFPLKNGPGMPVKDSVVRVTQFIEDNAMGVKAEFSRPENHVKWTLLPSGWLKLEFSYMESGRFDHLGTTFDLSAESVKKLSWMGRGPYRVWRNRMKGAGFGFWEKEYNNSITGVTRNYPEFKGYHADFYWGELQLQDERSIIMVNASDGIHLHMLTPEFPDDARNATAPFPEGDLSFMHAISPIGTKFHPADELGPQGRKSILYRGKVPPLSGIIYFKFE